jgi:uncharacterized protein (UPF0332 family)
MNPYLEAARLYLSDAHILQNAGGTPAGVVSQCWMAVSECVKALLADKGLVKIHDHRRHGELLARTYPDETELWTVYEELRRLHRDTYDTPFSLMADDARLATEDVERAIARCRELL